MNINSFIYFILSKSNCNIYMDKYYRSNTYINDLCNSSQIFDIIFYADEITLKLNIQSSSTLRLSESGSDTESDCLSER